MKRVVILGAVFITFAVQPKHLSAGAWTLPEGKLSLKTGFSYQKTSSRFCNGQDALSPAFRSIGCTEAGHRTDFDPFVGGELTAIALFSQISYGVTDRLEVGLSLPYFHLKFINQSDPNRSGTSSFGDLRFYSKFQLIDDPFTGAVQFLVKAPTGQFNVDAEIVNVSEGQWDFEGAGEIGKSLWPLPVYFNVQIGYRHRTDNDRFEYSFADEFFGSLEAGYHITGNLLLKGNLEWLRGQHPQIRNSGTELVWRRELLQLNPSIIMNLLHSLQLEAGLRIPLAGEDFPAGNVLNTALTYNLLF